MGLLSVGTPYDWPDSVGLQASVKKHALAQFLNLYNTHKHRRDPDMLWGDEIEYFILAESGTQPPSIGLALDPNLQTKVAQIIQSGPEFHEEFGRFMIESTPLQPYDASYTGLLTVFPSMRSRRQRINAALGSDAFVATLTSFPIMGMDPIAETDRGRFMNSAYLRDDVVNAHIRFPTLARNIRLRRGRNVDIRLPVTQHANTTEKEVAMDAMAFGMGCCCLQVTYQAPSVNEAMEGYDFLVPFAPLFMAISAASPIYRGRLTDRDCRWDVISGSVDDRTEEEMHKFPKSRYGSVSTYIADHSAAFDPRFNDIPLPISSEIVSELRNGGVPPTLSRHIAHYLERDALVIFSDNINQDDAANTDHFECYQSTNWQTVRFKPPPSQSAGGIGWRVEFRSMEVQISDWENAAYAVFVILFIRAVFAGGLQGQYYMPISQVDANMARAQNCDALTTGLFFWQGEERKIASIFREICNIVTTYINNLSATSEEKETLLSYVNLIEERSNGSRQTTACVIRSFVGNHKDYKHDSIISREINNDLILHLQRTHQSVDASADT